jgi:hypothetical protein
MQRIILYRNRWSDYCEGISSTYELTWYITLVYLNLESDSVIDNDFKKNN